MLRTPAVAALLAASAAVVLSAAPVATGWPSAPLNIPGGRNLKPWYISAPDGQLLSEIAEGGILFAEKEYPSYPLLQKLDLKKCRWEIKIIPDANPNIPKGSGREIDYRGFSARESVRSGVGPRKTRHYALAIKLPLPSSRLDFHLNMTYSWDQACPGWLQGMVAGIAESLNPERPSPPTASRIKELEQGIDLPGSAAAGPGGKKKPKATRAASRQATQRLRDAMAYLKVGSLYIAEQKVAEALGLDPTAQDVLVAEALVKKLSGEAEASAQQIEKIRADGGDPGASAYRLLKGLTPDPALRLPEIRPVPDGLVRGLLEEWDGRTDDALAAYDIAIENDPGNWLALALRGLMKLGLKDCKGARNDLRAAIRKNTNYTGYAFKGYAELCGAGETPE